MWKKIARRSGYVVAFTVGVCALLLVLVELTLRTAAGRELLRSQVNALVSDALGAQLEIEKLEHASLFYLRGSGLRLVAHGKPVATLEGFAIRLNPFALVTKTIAVRAAWLDRPYLDLGAPPERGGGGLLGLLAENATHERPEPAPSKGGGLDFAFHGVRISGGTFDASLAGARFAVTGLTLIGSLDLRDSISGRVGFVSFDVARDGEQVAALRGSQLRYVRDEFGGRLRLRTRRGELVGVAEIGKPERLGARKIAAEIYAHSITPADLKALGLDFEQLKSPLELSAHASGTTRAGSFELRLGTDGGSIQLSGRLREDDRVSATLQTKGLELERVFEAGGGRVAATIGLEAKFAHDFGAAELALHLTHGSYEDAPLPETEIKASYDEDHGFALDRLRANLPRAHGELLAQARIPKDKTLVATVSVHAETLEREPIVQLFAPGLSGALDARASVRRDRELRVQLELRARRFAFGAVKSEVLNLNLTAHGKSTDQLEALAELRATALSAGRVQFKEAALHLRADPRCYIAKASFGEQGRLVLRADRYGAAWIGRGSGEVALKAEQTLRLAIADVRYAEQTLTLGRVELAIGDASLRASGMVQPEGRVQIAAVLSVPDLAPLGKLVTTERVAGEIQLRATASGETKRPRIALAGRYRGERMFGLSNAELELDAHADAARRKLDLSAQLGAKHTAVKLELHSQLAEAELSKPAIERGKHDIVLEVGSFPLTEFTWFPTGTLRIASAELTGRVHATGTLRDPRLELEAKSRMRFHGDRDFMQLATKANYGDSKASLELEGSDAQGPLFHTALNSDLEPHGPLAHSVEDLANVLNERSWDADLWVRARRVDELPAVHAVALQPTLFPWKLSLHGKLAHKPRTEPEGELEIQALFDPRREPLHAARCGVGGAPRLTLEASMRDGKLGSKTTLDVQQKHVAEVTTRSPAPLDRWLGPSKPEPLDLVARFDHLSFASLPLVCDELGGELSGSVELRRAVTQAVTLKTELHGKNLAWGDAPKFDAYVEAHADHDDLRATADLKGAGGAATLSAKLPLDIKASVPRLRFDAPIAIEARLQEMSVESMLGGIPAVSADSGTIDGVVRVDGSLSDPNVRGGLALRKVSVTLGKLGQRFEDVTGKIVLDGHRFRLAETHIHDRGGTLVASGELEFSDREHVHAVLKASAEKYPMRRDGVVLGAISGKLQLAVKLEPGRTTLDIALRQAAIDLQEEDFGNVQSLKPNPDVRFLDVRAGDPKLASEEPSETVIHIDASEPMWIRREDFSVQISTTMTIVSAGETPEITGTLKIERGVIELIGQFFDIERGSIEFAGGHAIEPTLDLTAKRNVPGGGTVTVQARGRLHEPELTFMVDDRPVPAEQALAALSGSAAGSASMQDQLGSVATGMAAGVLTMGARRQLGDWVPMLAVESGANSTRVRAGVEARRLIPKFLRKVVVDAYVEGMVSSAQDPNETNSAAQQNSQTEAAVLLELRFPHRLIGEAQYGPGQRWSADLSWEP